MLPNKNTNKWVKLLIILQLVVFFVLLYYIRKNGAMGERTVIAQTIQGQKGEQGEKGADGYTPIKGIDYFDGVNGSNGAKGDMGDTGSQGEPGTSATTEQIAAAVASYCQDGNCQGVAGATTDQRCVAQRDGSVRIDQKLSTDTSWHVAYYLPIGSRCP